MHLKKGKHETKKYCALLCYIFKIIGDIKNFILIVRCLFLLTDINY